ncbi:hypothetical protein Avbf_05330 [Armadillidium vulgare]|nr:hypothetical protein Avbf_05330 [Armadillidium vulgare]
MISIPTSVDEEGLHSKNTSSLIKPQPPHHKSDTIQTENVTKRRSLVETEPFSTNSLKRKSSKTNLSTSKKSLGAMLFSAQDRISQFEKKKEDPENERTQKPFLRSKTSTLISDNQSKLKSTVNRSSLCENNKTPSIVCTRV